MYIYIYIYIIIYVYIHSQLCTLHEGRRNGDTPKPHLQTSNLIRFSVFEHVTNHQQ